jgi:hypothetical protein
VIEFRFFFPFQFTQRFYCCLVEPPTAKLEGPAYLANFYISTISQAEEKLSLPSTTILKANKEKGRYRSQCRKRTRTGRFACRKVETVCACEMNLSPFTPIMVQPTVTPAASAWP